MRKFLVHNFAGNSVTTCTTSRVASIIGLLPITILMLIFSFDWLLVVSAATLTTFLYLVPGTKEEWGYLRSMRITLPTWLIGGIILAFVHITLIHILIYLLLALSIWLSMYGFGIMYFDLFPLKVEELDEEQLKLYNSGQRVANLFKK